MRSFPAPVAERKAAESSRIAVAARAYGDTYPPLRGQWRVRGAGLLLVLTTLLYAPWMLSSLNGDVPWLAWPLAVANVFWLAYGLLAVVDAWSRRIPEACPLAYGDEPHVAVIIPTCGERWR